MCDTTYLLYDPIPSNTQAGITDADTDTDTDTFPYFI